MADGDGLARQPVNDCREIHFLGQNHGHVLFQHLAESLGGVKQDFSCTGARVMLVEFTLNDESERDGIECYHQQNTNVLLLI